MTYKGIARGKIIELEEPLPYSEGQAISVSVEAFAPKFPPGSAIAVLEVTRNLPDLDPHDVDELEQLIRKGKLPVHTQSVFESGEENSNR